MREEAIVNPLKFYWIENKNIRIVCIIKIFFILPPI